MIAALLVYRVQHIPRSVSDKDLKDLNERCKARIQEEQIIIRKPNVARGDLVLSYPGYKNEVAAIRLENAKLDPRYQHLLFRQPAAPAPGKISYTGGVYSHTPSGDTCRTTIEIRLADDSAPLEALALSQTDPTDPTGLRQVVLDAGASTMKIKVHTDSPTTHSPTEGADLLDCHKRLDVGGTSVNLPPFPVILYASGKIDLRFTPANSAWTDEFKGVALGDRGLRGSGLQVVATQNSSAPRLNVQARSARFTLSGLWIGPNMLKLDIGPDVKGAMAYEYGSSIYHTDLVQQLIKENLFLSSAFGAFAALLVTLLLNWVRKNDLPKKHKQVKTMPAQRPKTRRAG
jgi:hypothetical protein